MSQSTQPIQIRFTTTILPILGLLALGVLLALATAPDLVEEVPTSSYAQIVSYR